jgi:hypothetical protein
VGRKRSIVIDTVGLLLAVLVTAASVQDSVAGQTLVERVVAEHPTVRKTWVDGGYRQHLVEHAATLRVVICGGGVIGACTAYFLTRSGVEVTVVEQTGVACAASGRAGAFLARD